MLYLLCEISGATLKILSGIIDPYFHENANGVALSITSHGYRDFLTPELRNFAGFNEHTWFQQDGATSHVANLSMLVT